MARDFGQSGCEIEAVDGSQDDNPLHGLANPRGQRSEKLYRRLQHAGRLQLELRPLNCMPRRVVVPTKAALEEGVAGTQHGSSCTSEIIQVEPKPAPDS